MVRQVENKEGLTKHTLWLRDGDYPYLIDNLPPRQAAHAVRKLVANFVDGVRKKATEAQSPTEPFDPTEL